METRVAERSLRCEATLTGGENSRCTAWGRGGEEQGAGRRLERTDGKTPWVKSASGQGRTRRVLGLWGEGLSFSIP